MTGHRLPFLGDNAPALLCNRLVANGVNCGEPAVTHVFWDDRLENGLACVEHTSEIEEFDYLTKHPYDPVCSIAGADLMAERDSEGRIVRSWCEVRDGELLVAEKAELAVQS